MESLKSAAEGCGLGQNCWEWARIYMGYCLCSTRDGVSLALGLISVMSWAVAEIPQIITNYRHKGTEGLSLAFLFTWLVGVLGLLGIFGFRLQKCPLHVSLNPLKYLLSRSEEYVTRVVTVGQFEMLVICMLCKREFENVGIRRNNPIIDNIRRLFTERIGGRRNYASGRNIKPRDLLNVFGCQLEPATLPTQYYTAILYTLASFILTVQSIYYGHIYKRLKSNQKHYKVIPSEADHKANNDTYGIGKKENDHVHSLGKRINQSALAPSSPIPLPGRHSSGSPGGELYYSSARSLSISHTPTAGFIRANRTTSDAGLDPIMEPFLGEVIAAQSAPIPNTKPLLCAVSLVTLILGASNFCSSKNSGLVKIYPYPTGHTNLVGRRLLQASGHSLHNGSSNKSGGIGTCLGWGMASVYMGGRLPQICLNIRRGKVEGLNPLMFLFALLGNSTYVASILVSSLKWSKINRNLPWLVDACGCLLLDTCIVIQFIYFRYRAPRNVEIENVSAETSGLNHAK